MNSKKKPIGILGILIVLVIVFMIAIGPYLKMQQLLTMGLLPLLAIVAFFYDIYDLGKGKSEFLLFFMIFILSFFTLFYYSGYNEYIRASSSFFGAIIASYISIGLTKNINYNVYFHIGYILGSIGLILIMIMNGNIGINFASAIDFRDRFMLNANAYSYFCVFANFSLIYLYLKNKNLLVELLMVILPIIFLAITFTTQSRAGLILIILINLSFWLFINKSKINSRLKIVFRKIILIASIILFAIQIVKIYEGSRIQERVRQKSNSKDTRELLIDEGWEVFSNHPLFGVGLGQFPLHSKYGLFTHNSYIEILAEQGIFGFILLLILYLIPTFQSIKNFRKDSKNPLFRFYLVFFVAFLIYNNAYVFYKFPFSMMYFFLIVSLQKSDTSKFFQNQTNLSIKKF